MAFTPRRWHRAAASIEVGLLLSLPLVAHAQSSAADCAGDRPWVAVSGRASQPLTTAVRSELRAGLSPSNIEVCAAVSSPESEPLALVTVEELDAAGARYRLEVTDSVTKKRVSRDLVLDRLPADGRALALAVAAEELLRASWAELALRGVHSAGTEAPPEVRAVVERGEPAPVQSPFTALGARLGVEHFTGGQTHFGADLFAGLPLGRVASVLVAVGARRALSVQAPHGTIAASGFCGETGLSLAFFQRPGVDLAAFVSGRVLRLSFEPEADADAGSSGQSGVAGTARAGLSFAFGSRGVVRSYSVLGAGLPLRSFSAADSGQVVTGASELELFGAAGLALELP